MKKLTNLKGFTLIELLVVISIIGVLTAVSIFGLQGARASARDARRKADLEQVRNAVEIYKSDCNVYPASARVVLSGAVNLVGDNSTSSCLVANKYLTLTTSQIDPMSPTYNYLYYSTGASTYEVCAHLENGSGSVSCGGSTTCGSAANTCNYKVTNP